jgi:hypothetical protein
MTRQPLFSNSAVRGLWLLALCAAPLWTLWLIRAYGVDIPYWDQWDAACPIFEKLNAGTLGLADMMAFQNEHRVLFPRIVWLGLGLISHWNIRVELVAIWAMAAGCLLLLWRLSQATGFRASCLAPWLLAAASFLVFSPVQYETWLDGVQVAFLLPLLCLLASISAPLTMRPRAAFATVIALASVATFSLASGFLVWILAAPVLFLSTRDEGWKPHRASWIAYAALFAAEMALYVHGYQKPAQHPSPLASLRDPLSALSYVMAYLGSDFSGGTTWTPLIGFLLSILFLLCAASLWKRRSDRHLMARALPWMMLPCFAFASAILTTIGRVGFGIEQALATRYIIFSIMLPVGLLFLAPLLLLHGREGSARPVTRVVPAGALVLIVILLVGMQLHRSADVFQLWVDIHRSRLEAKATVSFINILPEDRILDKMVFSDVPLLKTRANDLNRLGYLRPALLKSAGIAEIADPAAPGAPEYGEIVSSHRLQSGNWRLSGCAELPDAGRPSDEVLLTFDDGKGAPVIFALARKMGLALSDIGKADAGADFDDSGWSEVVDPAALPRDATAVKAWSFNAETGRAYRLKGELLLR